MNSLLPPGSTSLERRLAQTCSGISDLQVPLRDLWNPATCPISFLPYLVGTDENVLVLNRTYANRSNAERAAKMQWERLQRGVASFSLQLAEGRADLYTEMPVKVSGFKQPIDDAEWTITTLTHTVSPDNGFTTSLELEVKIDDFEIE